MDFVFAQWINLDAFLRDSYLLKGDRDRVWRAPEFSLNLFKAAFSASLLARTSLNVPFTILTCSGFTESLCWFEATLFSWSASFSFARFSLAFLFSSYTKLYYVFSLNDVQHPSYVVCASIFWYTLNLKDSSRFQVSSCTFIAKLKKILLASPNIASDLPQTIEIWENFLAIYPAILDPFTTVFLLEKC